MRNASMKSRWMSSLAAMALLVGASSVRAEDDPNAATAAETARLTAEAARANAEAAKLNAEAARDKARIDSLGLPSFNGTTTLSGTNAGAMEANMLAMYALQAAADDIVSDAKGKAGEVVVLAGSENADLNQVVMIEAQLRGIRRELNAAMAASDRVRESSRHTFSESFALPLSPTMVVEAATAVAGLLRSETTVTAVDLASVSERALANAVAGRLANAYLPSAVIGRPAGPNSLLDQLEDLGRLRNDAALKLAAADPKSPKAIALTAAIKRFDDFSTKVTTVDEKGMIPIVRAAQLSRLFDGAPSETKILRVFVDRAGGTFVNTKNLGTFFGADPLRVTGGLVASYALTDPGTGQVLASNIFVCRTSLSRLRQIHDASWRGRPLDQGRCTPMAQLTGTPQGGKSGTAASR